MPSIDKMTICLLFLLSAAASARETEGKKCATFDRFITGASSGPNAKVAAGTARPVLPLSSLSPSKKFRIHFDTTGADTPALVTANGTRIPGTAAQYVDSVAKIFDLAWVAEVTAFGFAPPASDHGVGGGDEFDVYIQDRGANDFGLTEWDETAPVPGTTGAPRYPAYIGIDNDFGTGFRTMGMAGVRSVAAHEFFHAIQVGGYGWWGDDIYFYELTAEAMEPTVFSTSKDYIFDIGYYFGNIDNMSLYSPASGARPGYERAVWGIYLMKQYGVHIMRDMWESASSLRPIFAMKAALEKNGTSLGKEFSEFCYWNYFTGPRGDSVRYYTDAKLFPSVTVRERQTLGTTPAVFQYTCRGFGANYLQAVHAADTAGFIVANVNLDDALGSQSTAYGYQVRASLTAFDGGSPLANGWSAAFTVADPANWKYIPTSAIAAPLSAGVICFPNPFHPTVSSLLFGPLDRVQVLAKPRLSIFTAGNDLVFSGEVDVESSAGSTYAKWNGKNSRGDLAASGVYIYLLSAGESVVKGKFAVVR